MPETSLSGAALSRRERERRRVMRSVAGAAMVWSLMIFAGRASAGDAFQCPARPAETAAAERLARTLFEDAVAREPADPEGALARLRCAQRAADRPAIALRIGTIHERMGRLDDAAVAFERYLELAGKDAPDANEMREHVARLREGARRSRTPQPAAPPPRAQPSPAGGGQSMERPLIPPVIAWVVAGVGAATMVTGVVLLVDAAAKDESVHELRGQRWSDEAAGPTHDAAKTEQAFGIAGLVAGAVIGAAGLSSALSGKPSVTVTAAAARGPRARIAIRF